MKTLEHELIEDEDDFQEIQDLIDQERKKDERYEMMLTVCVVIAFSVLIGAGVWKFAEWYHSLSATYFSSIRVF